MLRAQQGISFKNIHLPDQDPVGSLTGKYDYKNVGNDQCLSHLSSRFEWEMLHTMKQMYANSKNESDFIMNYDKVYNIIKQTYNGSLKITENYKISDWQIVKKAYYFQKGFGIDLDKYENISKEDLINLQNADGGLISYVIEKHTKNIKLETFTYSIKDEQIKVFKKTY